MAEIDLEYVERIKREHDDYLARKARYTGSPYKSSVTAVLPIHTSVDEEELAKVRKENEKLLDLVNKITRALESMEKIEILNRNHVKDLNDSILIRMEDILNGK